MTTLQSANMGLGFGDYPAEATTPTTPRAPVMPVSQARPHSAEPSSLPAAATPTAANFGGISGQLPLPGSPIHTHHPSSQPVQESLGERTMPNKRDSQLSLQTDDSQDITMDESDGEGDAGSDNETVDPETGRATKKKKGQRFFCTDFPPCRLSFTRSEHLARHIRKHTGERPFQCHCSRRFSRLDNLRQHAQTVHVNEEIPVDSLAATGTRFQRQIRTDRVSRPPHSRSRASTVSSTGSHHRGHGRNLSTSSVGSTMSTISTFSRDDARRRPATIIMASDPSKPGMGLDLLRRQTSTPPAQTTFFREPSEGTSTPTSTVYSTGGHSPGYGSSMGSPALNARNSGYWEPRGHGRRLSVPSAPMPFQSQFGNTYSSPHPSPLPSSSAANFPYINSSYGSPAGSTNASTSRDAAEAELRRRTWHPTPHTYTNFSRPGLPTSFTRPATSGLMYKQTPEHASTSFGSPMNNTGLHTQRLPGIETFDQASRRPLTPPSSYPPRVGSPMQIDSPSLPQAVPAGSMQSDPSLPERRGHSSWDMSLHQNLTKLDLRGNSYRQETPSWPSHRPVSRPGPIAEDVREPVRAPVIHQEVESRPSQPAPATSMSNRSKRQGWYAGPPMNPVTSHPRTSPAGSTSSEGVPKTPTAPVMEPNPSIRHSNGFYDHAPVQPQGGSLHEGPGPENSQPAAWPIHHSSENEKLEQDGRKRLSNLDLLVAAATSQDKAAPKA